MKTVTTIRPVINYAGTTQTLVCNNPTALKNLRLAMSCTAKNDVRHYLNGIYINPYTGETVGTDGHRLVATKAFECNKFPAVILRIAKMLPKNLAEVKIDVTIESVDERNGTEQITAGSAVITCTTARGATTLLTGEILDGTYPDYQRVLPDRSDQTGAGHIRRVTFNPRYLEEMVTAYCDRKAEAPRVSLIFDAVDGAPNTKMQAGEVISSIRVNIEGSDARIVLMPCRAM